MKCVKFCEEVNRRTNANAVYNHRLQNVMFYFGDEPVGGPIAIPVNGSKRWDLTGTDIDDTVYVLQRCKNATRESNDEIQRKNELEQAKDQEQHHGHYMESQRRDILTAMDRKSKAIRGLNTVTA
jgi:hypothetical protein